MQQSTANDEVSAPVNGHPLAISTTSESERVVPEHGESTEQQSDHSEAWEDEQNDNIEEDDAILMEPMLGDSSSGEDSITMDEAMERLGYGMFQNKILVASGCCFAADAMQVLMLSFLSLVLKAEWKLSSSKAQSITSCLFAGALVGTLVLGPAADSVGRRPVFLCSACLITFFGFLCSLAAKYWILMVLLFCVGFGIGGLVVPFDVFAEFLPSEGRGKLLLAIVRMEETIALNIAVLASIILIAILFRSLMQQYFWTLGCMWIVKK